jgi:hypothetical protein
MSIRFDALEYAFRTASVIPFNAPYTVAAHVYLDVDTNDFAHIFHVGGTNIYDGVTDFIGTDSDGTTIRGIQAGGASNEFLAGALNLAVGSWYYIAFVRASATSAAIWASLASSAVVSQITSSQNVGSRTAATNMQFGSYNGKPINGRMYRPRVWTAALSEAELNTERQYKNAQRTANLWAEILDDLTDRSGNSRNFTASGTLTTAADPPGLLDDPSTGKRRIVSSTGRALVTAAGRTLVA